MSGSRLVASNWFRIIGVLLMVAGLAVLPGCSAVRLAYNNLPDLAYWWVDGYADLDETQSQALRRELDGLHQWHRAQELPQLAGTLQRVQNLARGHVDAAQMCALFDELRGRMDAVARQAEPGIVSLAASLTPRQIRHVEERLAKRNAEWRDEWGAGDERERRERRLKAMVERAEQFYGTLEETQRAVLRHAIAQSDFSVRRSYAERLRRQQDMLQTLRRIAGADGEPRPDHTQALRLLRAYQERIWRSPDPAYRAYAEKAVQNNCRTWAELHNRTTAEQRERAATRIGSYARDARELAARAGAPAG